MTHLISYYLLVCSAKSVEGQKCISVKSVKHISIVLCTKCTYKGLLCHGSHVYYPLFMLDGIPLKCKIFRYISLPYKEAHLHIHRLLWAMCPKWLNSHHAVNATGINMTSV